VRAVHKPLTGFGATPFHNFDETRVPCGFSQHSLAAINIGIERRRWRPAVKITHFLRQTSVSALGTEGWTMPVCTNETRPSGEIRYEWTNGKGGGFYL